MKTINIVTLGCSKNKVDSEHLAGLLASGYEILHDSDVLSDVVVINTCGFIGDAKEESIDTILSFAEARKSGEIDKLIVMGCLSQRYNQELKNDIHEVDAFFGVNDLNAIAALLNINTNGLPQPYHYNRILSTPQHYAYLKISEGCERSCSFCAIPLIRGKHRSVPVEQLMDEARNLAAAGVKELILIAQDLTYYGIDINGKRQITNLVDQLSGIEGIEWIRLQYAYPIGFPEDLIDLIASNPKVCKYIDLPLQHISQRILKSMKRGVDKDQTIELIKRIREKVPDIAFRTTLIVGYPGETEDEFEELIRFVEEQRFERLGVFAYSAEEGTSAYDLEDNVTEEIKQFRVNRIMEIQQNISLQINTLKIGKIERALIDRIEDDYFIGRTQYDSPEVDNEILIPKENHELVIGQFYSVLITAADDFDLYATAI
ncbi:MAG: 30S ribosomal protein S12 methylthiotransferase RimO [Bacteroidales bacterium]|nr:30S ribosomal protein S12 methylthiotransferase RimO [Bacteroidales bacterium]